MQQSRAQVRLAEQQVEEVGGCDAVEGLGAGAEVQSRLEDTERPLRDLKPQRQE